VARDMLLKWAKRPTGLEAPVQALPGEAAR
jgi:hypothetical protein